MYATVQKAVESGNLQNFLETNITTGQKASLLWAIDAGRFVQTIGLFILGFWLSKKNVSTSSEYNTRFWVKILIVSSLLFGLLYPLKVNWLDSTPNEAVKASIGTVLNMWQKLAFTFVIVSSFVISYYASTFVNCILVKLKIYGKMSLTNYVSQSIIGAIVYFPIGLHLSPYLGYTASLLVGGIIFLIQLYCCQLWSKHFSQGPLEKIWHKATWIRQK